MFIRQLVPLQEVIGTGPAGGLGRFEVDPDPVGDDPLPLLFRQSGGGGKNSGGGSGKSAPTDILLDNSTVDESAAPGTPVGTLSAVDSDRKESFTYRLLDDAGGHFTIDGDQLVTSGAAGFDAATSPTYDITIEVTDKYGLTYVETITIEVAAPTTVQDPAASTVQDPAASTEPSVPQYVLDALLPGGTSGTTPRWNADAELGSPATVSFSFLTAVPDYYTADAPERTDFAPMTAEQQAAVREALALIASLTGLTFVEATDGTGQLTFGTADLPQGTGWAYLPGSSQLAGDVWLDNTVAANLDMTPGGDGFVTLLHEIGHALGLAHPFEGMTLPVDETNRQYTVMAYSEHPLTGGGEPISYMLYDIAALQYLYGANGTATAGDNVYDVANADGLVTTIWDVAGWDVLDASGSTLSVVLDLNQGAFSTSGTVYGWYPVRENIAIAYGTVIEEARGGLGADVIIGNAADNLLTGGAGADRFVFAADWGTDLITDFQGGLDLLDFSFLGIGFADLQLAELDGSAVISFGADMLTLDGVALAAVDETDFVFAATV